jgi:hypothetical protein
MQRSSSVVCVAMQSRSAYYTRPNATAVVHTCPNTHVLNTLFLRLRLMLLIASQSVCHMQLIVNNNNNDQQPQLQQWLL